MRLCVRASLLVWLLFTLVALNGCTPAHMAVSPQLAAGAPAMPVRGNPQYFWQDGFSFGPYRVSGKDRSWVTATGFAKTRDWLHLFGSDARQTLAFTLTPPHGSPLACRCTTRANQQVLEASHSRWGELSLQLGGEVNYACRFQPLGGGSGWDLGLRRTGGAYNLSGFLLGPTGQVRIEGTNALHGTSIGLSETTGYRFFRQGQEVGAVEVINQGSVRLSPWLDPQTKAALAATAAALLLYKDVSPRY